MRILIFNFKDLKNPYAGGAERVTEECARRWVKAGHEVTLIVPQFPGSLPKETVEGVEIIRVGNRWTVYWQAFKYYKKNLAGKFDLIIDEINAVPFFTPLYAKEKVSVLIFQLTREIWFYELFFPLNIVGYILEPIWLWLLYRNKIIVTESESTKQGLIKFGFEEKNIFIIPMAINFSPVESLEKVNQEKEKDPTILYFGFMRPMKRVEEVVKGFYELQKKMPDVKLWLAGDGYPDYVQKIKKYIKVKNFDNKVKFWGKVAVEEKISLLRRAHLISMTSIREGWGLVVTEANACGTPAVVYNIPGLRDSTINGETGLVCQNNTPRELARNFYKLLVDKELYDKMQRNGWERAKRLSWDKTADEFMKILN
jgi:glycosyltransferase involved in cell wall biosynthesis